MRRLVRGRLATATPRSAYELELAEANVVWVDTVASAWVDYVMAVTEHDKLLVRDLAALDLARATGENGDIAANLALAKSLSSEAASHAKRLADASLALTVAQAGAILDRAHAEIAAPATMDASTAAAKAVYENAAAQAGYTWTQSTANAWTDWQLGTITESAYNTLRAQADATRQASEQTANITRVGSVGTALVTKMTSLGTADVDQASALGSAAIAYAEAATGSDDTLAAQRATALVLNAGALAGTERQHEIDTSAEWAECVRGRVKPATCGRVETGH